MVEFLQVAVAVLGLLSVGHSAPLISCESLITPIHIQGREQLLGSWRFIGESTNIPASRQVTKMFVDGGNAKMTAVADRSDAIAVLQTQRMLGSCFSVTSELTLANNTLSSVRPFISTAVLLTTSCPDCLVSYANYTIAGRSYRGLQILSRRGELTSAELEEFKKQVECLRLPAPAILDPERDSCSDAPPAQETDTVDLTDIMNSMGPDILSLLDTLKNNNWMQELLKNLPEASKTK